MIITLFPQRRDDSLDIVRSGSVLAINGDDIDLTTYSAGDCDFIIGQPIEDMGVWSVDIILPHGPIPDETSPESAAVLFPDIIEMAADGAVDIPSFPADIEE